jgi:hypothetical protein
MVVRLMINAAGCGVPSSPSGGTVVPAQGRTHQRRPGPGGPPSGGVAGGGGVPGGGVGSQVGGVGFAARLPLLSCRAEYPCITAG